MIAEILSKKKLIESPTANRAGLQLARIMAARLALWVRGGPLPAGFVLIHDFLAPDDLELVRREFADGISDRGISRIDGYGLEARKAPVLPGSETDRAIFGDDRWKQIFRKRESSIDLSLRGTEARYERISFADKSQSDHSFSTAIVHSDTFHSITKAFLFLEETQPEHGAFRYAPRSNRLTLGRLLFEYRNSNERFEHSPQPTEDELSKMGFELQPICCPANTLMIVDVFGFHARGIVQPGFERHAVCWEYRSNPFALR